MKETFIVSETTKEEKGVVVSVLGITMRVTRNPPTGLYHSHHFQLLMSTHAILVPAGLNTSEVQRSWELLSLVAAFPAKKSFRYLMDLVCFSYSLLLQSHFCISVLRQGNILPSDLSLQQYPLLAVFSVLLLKKFFYRYTLTSRDA